MKSYKTILSLAQKFQRTFDLGKTNVDTYFGFEGSRQVWVITFTVKGVGKSTRRVMSWTWIHNANHSEHDEFVNTQRLYEFAAIFGLHNLFNW